MGKIFGLLEYDCLRCGHHWQLEKPIKLIKCPECQSKYWNIPKNVKSTATNMITEEIENILLSNPEGLTVFAKQLGELQLDTLIKQLKTSYKNRDWDKMEDSINLLDDTVHHLMREINSIQR